MKNSRSFRTFLPWVFLLVVIWVGFQLLNGDQAGTKVSLSEFLERALPATDGTGNVQSGRIAEVHVHGAGLIEYALRPRPSDVAADVDAKEPPKADAKADGDRPLEWFHTRGDIEMGLGGPEDNSLLAALVQRGVKLVFSEANAKAVQPRGSDKPFSVFVAEVQRLRPPTEVAKVIIEGKEIRASAKADGVPFHTVGTLGDYYRRELIARGVEVEEKDNSDSMWISVIGTFLPLVLIIAIFVIFMRQLQAGGGKAMSFGKSRHRLLSESANKVTFNDIAGIEEAKEELQEIIHFLKDPKKFTRLGGRIPKGVLLMGPPGTGKTLLAKGVAGEAGVPFFTISGSDFVEMFVGVGASRVRDLFEQGKKNAPCIIFIDEIDAVGRHRGAGLGGGHDEREQTLNQLLVEMDGFESNEGVILVAATNRPDVLDPALLRPGRFDRRVVVNRPDVKGRTAILKVHTRKTRVSDDVDLAIIARGTPGFSGADLENLVNEAALLAARRDKDAIDANDFDSAKDKVLMGAERRSAALTDEDKRITAYHEAGHTLVAQAVPGNDPVHKVTIIPRGMALGVTWTLPEADHTNLSKEQVLARIAMAMGGRVAEELVFGHITTGAGNDIEQATKLARRMVTEWGMSELGPIALSGQQGSVFLGRELGGRSDFSQSTMAEADKEVRRILDEQYDVAVKVIEERRGQLETLAQALLEFESLDGAEVGLAMGEDWNERLRAHRESKAPSVTPAPAPEEPSAPAPVVEAPVVTALPDPEPATRTRLS